MTGRQGGTRVLGDFDLSWAGELDDAFHVELREVGTEGSTEQVFPLLRMKISQSYVLSIRKSSVVMP